MQRIDNSTVELDATEVIAKRTFNELLDSGYTIPQAVRGVRDYYPECSEEFFAYLGE